MITVDQAARERLDSLLPKGSYLRVQVIGGGCAGYQYRLGIDQITDDDHTYDIVIVDPDSLPLVEGSTITYKDDGFQAGFVVENPNARKACGCGSSFVIDD